MSIRIITKKTGRVYARMHSMLFHMGKGNCEDGNPYGIIPTGQSNPLGLSFAKIKPLKISIRPGQFCCYGRQCIITEETTIIEDMATEWTKTDRCYATVYAEINLNDVVDQKCTIKADLREQAFIDFRNDMERQNLYRRANGIYDVPIARFIYDPQPSREDYYTDYERLISTFSSESRAEAKELSDKMFGVKVDKLIDDGYFTIPAIKAEHATGVNSFGKNNPIGILSNLHGLYSCKRVKLLTFGSFTDFQVGIERKIFVNIDNDHLVGVCFWIGNEKEFSATFRVRGLKSGVKNVPATIDNNRRADYSEGMHRVYLMANCNFDRDHSDNATIDLYISKIKRSVVPVMDIDLYMDYSTGKPWIAIRGLINQNEAFSGGSGPLFIETPIINNPNGTAIYADFFYKGDVDVF